jgi:hypothetical protein
MREGFQRLKTAFVFVIPLAIRIIELEREIGWLRVTGKGWTGSGALSKYHVCNDETILLSCFVCKPVPLMMGAFPHVLTGPVSAR